MPPTRTRPGAPPDLAKLYGLAEAQLGHFTSAQATSAGFSAPLLHHHVGAKRFERVARGIYRFVQFPAGEHEDLVVVWLWSRQQGTFSHETALALHELSDALPAVQHLTLPASWRQRRVRVPASVSLHFGDVPPGARAWRGAVPVTAPLRTVIDCVRDHVDPRLVAQAFEQGMARGLFARGDAAEALRAAGLDPRRLLPRPAKQAARRS